jgi:peptide/nickel transport system substrate-binding protein
VVGVFLAWQDFSDLDPAFAYGSESIALNNCYENLIWYNPPGSEELLTPGLATSWEPNEDSTEWTFHLREGVTFQDGEPFNADAVEATFEHYWAAEGAGCSWIWGAVEEVEVVDDYTVKFHCTEPTALDLISTTGYCGGMMSPAAADKPKEWFDAGVCVGTGPYTIESFESGQRLIMTRFDDYWGGWKENQFDKVVFEIVNDPTVQLQMIEGGEADFFFMTPPDKASELQAMDNLQVHFDPSFRHVYYLLNTQVPPLDDVRVREALAWSYPYDDIIERTGGSWTQSRGMVPITMWGHCEDCVQYHQDLDKARELLAEAGYPDGGFELELTYIPTSPDETWPSELWPYALQELGIDLKLLPLTWTAQGELMTSGPEGAQDIFTGIWWPDWVTPMSDLYGVYGCEVYYNAAYYCNPEFDEMINEASRLTGVDRERATELFIEAQKLLEKDVVTIPIADVPVISVLSADIEGYVFNPAYTRVPFLHQLTVTR